MVPPNSGIIHIIWSVGDDCEGTILQSLNWKTNLYSKPLSILPFISIDVKLLCLWPFYDSDQSMAFEPCYFIWWPPVWFFSVVLFGLA